MASSAPTYTSFTAVSGALSTSGHISRLYCDECTECVTRVENEGTRLTENGGLKDGIIAYRFLANCTRRARTCPKNGALGLGFAFWKGSSFANQRPHFAPNPSRIIPMQFLCILPHLSVQKARQQPRRFAKRRRKTHQEYPHVRSLPPP